MRSGTRVHSADARRPRRRAGCRRRRDRRRSPQHPHAECRIGGRPIGGQDGGAIEARWRTQRSSQSPRVSVPPHAATSPGHGNNPDRKRPSTPLSSRSQRPANTATRDRTKPVNSDIAVVAAFNCFSMSAILVLGAIQPLAPGRHQWQSFRGKLASRDGWPVTGIAIGAARHLFDQSGRNQLAQAILNVGNVVAIAETTELTDAAWLRPEHQLLKNDVLLAGQIVLSAGRSERCAGKAIEGFSDAQISACSNSKKALSRAPSAPVAELRRSLIGAVWRPLFH